MVRAILEAVVDAIVTMDDQGVVQMVNRAGERMFGYDASEIVGQDAMMLFAAVISGASHEDADPVQALQTEGSYPRRLEVIGVRRDGSEFPVDITISDAWTPGGGRLFVAVMRDITQQRTVDQEVRRAREVANRAKSEFLATMSHELRTPLNTIIGFSELLENPVVGPLNARQSRYLGHVLESGRVLLQLIDDLLDLSEVESESMTELEWSTFPTAGLLNDLEPIARGLAKKKGITFGIDYRDEVAELTGDQRRLKQILFNLIDNAIKFTPSGGQVTVTCGTEVPPDARDDQDAWVWFTVADNGIGIAEPDQERIFGSFERVDSALDRAYAGVGLGLPLSRRLAELHHGRLKVQSDGPGMGASFTLEIPANGRGSDAA